MFGWISVVCYYRWILLARKLKKRRISRSRSKPRLFHVRSLFRKRIVVLLRCFRVNDNNLTCDYFRIRSVRVRAIPLFTTASTYLELYDAINEEAQLRREETVQRRREELLHSQRPFTLTQSTGKSHRHQSCVGYCTDQSHGHGFHFKVRATHCLAEVCLAVASVASSRKGFSDDYVKAVWRPFLASYCCYCTGQRRSSGDLEKRQMARTSGRRVLQEDSHQGASSGGPPAGCAAVANGKAR